MKLSFTVSLLTAAVVLAGCAGPGTVKMDSARSAERVSETIRKYINPAEYRPVSLYWYEREELSNNMEYLLVEMVGTDGSLYTQTFKVGGGHQGPTEVRESRSHRKYDFATIKYITPADVDPAAIAGWIDAAKAELSGEYGYESIGGYTFRVDPATGDKTSGFNIRATGKDNNGVKSRSLLTTYREIGFEVLADGTVVMEKE